MSWPSDEKSDVSFDAGHGLGAALPTLDPDRANAEDLPSQRIVHGGVGSPEHVAHLQRDEQQEPRRLEKSKKGYSETLPRGNVEIFDTTARGQEQELRDENPIHGARLVGGGQC